MARRIAVCLFIACASAYVLGYRGATAGDDLINLQDCEHLASTGTLGFSPAEYNPRQAPLLRFFFREGTDQRVYTVLAPGLPVASSPFCWMAAHLFDRAGTVVRTQRFGSEVQGRAPDAELARLRADPLAFAAGLINPLCIALVVTAFFVFGLLQGSEVTWAALCSLVLGFGTLLWCYAESYWSQPLCLACLLGGLCLLRAGARPGAGAWFGLLGGAVVGCAGLARYESFAFAAVLVATASFVSLRAGRPGRAILPSLGFLGPVLLAMGWNAARFGSVLSTGSPHGSLKGLFGGDLGDRLAVSLVANTFGLNQGLFIFAPPVLVSLCVGLWCWRRLDPFERVGVLLGLTMVGFYSAFTLWEAGPAWGPRFLVLAVPFLMLPILRHGQGRARRWLYGAGLLGTALQLPGILLIMDSDVMRRTNLYFSDGPASFNLTSEIGLQASRFLERGGDVFWWMRSAPAVCLGLLVLAAGVTATVVGARSAFTLLHEAPSSPFTDAS